VIKILVANKVDMPDEKKVITKEMGEDVAKRYNMLFFEASAKTGLGVTEAFEKVCDLYIAR
tara:strand:- start:225 stop:407 length:183 start_codon:yes stop_codon:yes gene_type:complete